MILWGSASPGMAREEDGVGMEDSSIRGYFVLSTDLGTRYVEAGVMVAEAAQRVKAGPVIVADTGHPAKGDGVLVAEAAHPAKGDGVLVAEAAYPEKVDGVLVVDAGHPLSEAGVLVAQPADPVKDEPEALKSQVGNDAVDALGPACDQTCEAASR